MRLRIPKTQYLIPLLAALAAPCARAQVTIEANIGLEGFYRVGEWTPVTVTLGGNGVNAQGQLQMTVRSDSQSVRYVRSIGLRAGPLRESYTLYCRNDGGANDIEVRLVAEGRQLASKKVLGGLQSRPDQPMLVSLASTPASLAFLNRKDLGFPHRSPENRYSYGGYPGAMPQPGFGGQPGQAYEAQVVYLKNTLPPDSPAGYEAADVIVLGDYPIDTLTADQQAALRNWVLAGGTLIVSGGADTGRFRNPFLAELIPMTAEGTRAAGSMDELTRRFHAPPPKGVGILVGALKPGAQALYQEGGSPLVSVRPLGLGAVVMTAFDCTSSDMRGWPGAAALWREMAKQGDHSLSAFRVMAASQRAMYGGSGQGLADALAGVKASEFPGFGVIGLFLLGYIVCLVPVNYFLLRMRDKKELAWLTAPLIILAFSGGAYAIGYSIKGNSLYFNRVTVLETRQGEEQAVAYTAMGVFSPRRTAYQLAIGERNALADEINDTRMGGRLNGDYTVALGEKTRLEDIGINMWASRAFDVVTYPNLGGKITANLKRSTPGVYELTIKNETPYALEDCGLSSPHISHDNNAAPQTLGMLPLGRLEPGQTLTTTFGWEPNRSNVAQGMMLGWTRSNEELQRAEVRQRLMGAALQTLQTNETGLPGSKPFVFYGWRRESPVSVALEGANPVSEDVNLLVVHLKEPK